MSRATASAASTRLIVAGAVIEVQPPPSTALSGVLRGSKTRSRVTAAWRSSAARTSSRSRSRRNLPQQLKSGERPRHFPQCGEAASKPVTNRSRQTGGARRRCLDRCLAEQLLERARRSSSGDMSSAKASDVGQDRVPRHKAARHVAADHDRVPFGLLGERRRRGHSTHRARRAPSRRPNSDFIASSIVGREDNAGGPRHTACRKTDQNMPGIALRGIDRAGANARCATAAAPVSGGILRRRH